MLTWLLMYNRFALKMFGIDFSTSITLIKKQDQFGKHLAESVSQHFEGDCSDTLRVLQPIWALMRNDLN